MFIDLLRNLDMLHHRRGFLDGLFPNTDWSGIRHPVLRLRASVVRTLHFVTAFKRGLAAAVAAAAAAVAAVAAAAAVVAAQKVVEAAIATPKSAGAARATPKSAWAAREKAVAVAAAVDVVTAVVAAAVHSDSGAQRQRCKAAAVHSVTLILARRKTRASISDSGGD